VPLSTFDYAARLASLQAHGIGLWDVIAEARRPGSLDANIRDAHWNPLAEALSGLPNLACIGFNGRTAASIGRRQLAGVEGPRWTLVDLPSSSPAYTLSFEAKLAHWRAALCPPDEPFIRLVLT
jgi:hypoxanthine-DNA glycosylase